MLADIQVRPHPVSWSGVEPTLITDASGIGDVLLEDMRRDGLDPVGIIITGGGSATRDERDPKLWHVARNILVATLKQRLGNSLTLRCSTDMAVEIAKEAANMQYSITAALHEHTDPRQGKHDDLLLSVAMGCWLGANEGPPLADIDPQEIQKIWAEAGIASGQPDEPMGRRSWNGRRHYW